MRRPRFVSHLVILAGVTSVFPVQAAPDVPKIVGKLPALETFSLPNGLQVAVLRSEVAPVVSVQVWYHAGSKDEPRERRGTAHMFEHMMFQGTEQVRPRMPRQSTHRVRR